MLVLDLQHFAGERTEKATPKRRKKQREQGNIAQSQDLVSSISFLMALFVIKALSGNVWSTLYQSWVYDFSHVGQFNMTQTNVLSLLEQQVLLIIKLIYPFLLAPMIIGIIANYAQVKFVFLPNLLIPKFSRINPLTGIRKMFGVNGVVSTIQSIFKLCVTGGLVYFSVQSLIPQIEDLSQLDIVQYAPAMGAMIYGVLQKVAIALVALAVFDFVYQKFVYEKRMKMSKDDIKDERKEIDGNPMIKGKIRQMGRQIIAKRIAQRVATADVIITNPTHFAVALQYQRGTRAPIVVAKGQDEVALRIRKMAREHEVPIVENKPLARELYKLCDEDDPVPIHLFKAVAEILAHVYRKRGRRAK